MSSPNPHDVVLLCNPQAGGRWRALADVPDSDEAKGVRRIVTDEIDDVAEALSSVGRRAKLLCIYGGDGTIYHVINQLLSRPHESMPRLALLGGGTMNVTGRLCGMTGSPGDNFRSVMRAYLTDQLLWRDMPVVEVEHGEAKTYGFTFGLGPLVHPGPLRARPQRQAGGARHRRAGHRRRARADQAGHGQSPPMTARVYADGEQVPHDRFCRRLRQHHRRRQPHGRAVCA